MSLSKIQECPHECKGPCQRPRVAQQNFDAINYDDVSFDEINFDLWNVGFGKRLLTNFLTYGAILISLGGLAFFNF